MKPARFEYADPRSLSECLHLLAAGDREVRVLAGGQSLVPLLNLRLVRADLLVDINRVPELRRADFTAGGLTVGAGVRMAELERDARLAGPAPLLAALLPLVGHAAVRSRATVCGSLAHADPAAELPAAALALDATVTLASTGGERTLAARDFILGPLTTAIAAGEIVRSVHFPAPPAGTAFGVAEEARRHGDFATAGAIAGLRVEAGRVAAAGITVFALAGSAARLRSLEAELLGLPVAPSLPERAGARAAELVEVWPAAAGSEWYGRRLAAAVVERAVAAALGDGI